MILLTCQTHDYTSITTVLVWSIVATFVVIVGEGYEKSTVLYETHEQRSGRIFTTPVFKARGRFENLN